MQVIDLLNKIYCEEYDELPRKIKVNDVIFYKNYVKDTIEYRTETEEMIQEYFMSDYNTKEILKLEVEEVEENVRWKPKREETYFYINDYGTIHCNNWYNGEYDNWQYDTNNCFRTEKEAEQHLENIKTEAELRQLAEELNKGEKIDWEDKEQYKYYISLDTTENEINFNWTSGLKEAKTIYCVDERFKDEAIKYIGEDRLIQYLKGEVNGKNFKTINIRKSKFTNNYKCMW